MPLTALPNELLLHISSYLHPRHHSALIRTNHRLHSALSDALIASLCQPSSEITSNSSSKWASKALYSTLTSQDAKTVQRLVSRGVARVIGKPTEVGDVSCSTRKNRALLNDVIVTLQSTDAIRLLLQCGVGADTKELVSGWTPLFRAIDLGRGDTVRPFPNREDADANLQDYRSSTPLYRAVPWCKGEVARALLDDPRVDVNQRYHQEGRTVLHLAIHCYNIGVVRALLGRQDIDVNILAEHGGTPLHHAAMKGFGSGVETLLERPDVKLDVLDSEGKTVLHAAAAVPGTGGILRLLLARDGGRLPPLNLRELAGGCTPLHLAVISGDPDIVYTLLSDSRVDVNVPDGAGATPLYRAAVMGREVLLRMLLDHPGSDPARAFAGMDIGDPSACECSLPDVSRNVLMEYLSQRKLGVEGGIVFGN